MTDIGDQITIQLIYTDVIVQNIVSTSRTALITEKKDIMVDYVLNVMMVTLQYPVIFVLYALLWLSQSFNQSVYFSL